MADSHAQSWQDTWVAHSSLTWRKSDLSMKGKCAAQHNPKQYLARNHGATPLFVRCFVDCLKNNFSSQATSTSFMDGVYMTGSLWSYWKHLFYGKAKQLASFIPLIVVLQWCLPKFHWWWWKTVLCEQRRRWWIWLRRRGVVVGINTLIGTNATILIDHIRRVSKNQQKDKMDYIREKPFPSKASMDPK